MIGVKTLVRQWAYKCSVKKKKKAMECHGKYRCFPGGSVEKNPPAMQEVEGRGVDPWVRKILWRRKWQPTPVFLPRESHGQRSLGATVLGFTGESDTN